MKSSKNILDFFKVPNTNLPCPACGILLPKSRMNIHLDSDCPSSVSSMELDNVPSERYSSSTVIASVSENPKYNKNTKMEGRVPRGTLKSKSFKASRLSLKQQKINAVKKIRLENPKCDVEPEVITLDDDASSSVCSNNVKSSTLVNPEISRGPLLQKKTSFAITNSENEQQLFVPIKNVEGPQLQYTEKNNIQKHESSNKAKEESSNSVKIADKISPNSVHHTSITNNSPNKYERVRDTMHSHPNDSTINIMSKNAEELGTKTDSEMNADIIAMINDTEEFTEADDVFSENKEQSENYSPYYIANFKHILNTVLNDDYNKILFNDEDLNFTRVFENLSDSAQKLYVRLFQRKYKWLRLHKINYPNITKDPVKVLDELVNVGLMDLGLDKIDLETALDLLSLSEARLLAKHFKFPLSVKNKADITLKLLKHCREHKSVFFCNGKNNVSNMMLKKVKDVLGPCYRISILPKRLFTRILMLFSLPTMSEDDDDAAGGQQQQLLTLLQVNKGELTFPDYKVNREMKIFIERDELIRYEEARQIENDIINAVENKNFELGKKLYITAEEEFETQLGSPFVERAASLPTFLKKFTSFHVYVRCLTQGVEILQRLREYKEAVDLLKKLLAQKMFCQDYRGRWWERLALNLEQHLKQRQQALEAIKKGIKDKNVRAGHRHSLLTRALRLLKSVDEKDELKNEILEAATVIEAPKIVIRGRLCPRNILGRRHVFISSSSTLAEEDDITVLNVEQLAIEHYKNEGFPEGIHGESSTFHSLYGLLFWDLIYDGDIPDAFISPYQTHPLDLNHDSFFIRREKQIMSHLESLKSSTLEEVKEIVKSSWAAHFGQTSLVMWDRFTDVEHALGLVDCMGTDLFCGICERLARDFRFTRSGVPDLVVWNPKSLQVKIVEVKGPGDKLSSKQILWLDYLLKLGAQAEVCHVEAVGSKKLNKE